MLYQFHNKDSNSRGKMDDVALDAFVSNLAAIHW